MADKKYHKFLYNTRLLTSDFLLLVLFPPPPRNYCQFSVIFVCLCKIAVFSCHCTWPPLPTPSPSSTRDFWSDKQKTNLFIPHSLSISRSPILGGRMTLACTGARPGTSSGLHGAGTQHYKWQVSFISDPVRLLTLLIPLIERMVLI